MNKSHFDGERVEVISTKSFSETIAAFERRIPMADISVFARLVAAAANAREIENVVEGMAGDLGFLILAKLDQGPLVSLMGKKKKMTVYLIGNPVLANRMYERHPAIGVYAPLRVLVYEAHDGKTRVTYDRPSTLLEQFGDDQVRSVARTLDERMSRLTADLIQGTDLELEKSSET